MFPFQTQRPTIVYIINFNVEADAFLRLSTVMGRLIVLMDQMSPKVVGQIDYESVLRLLTKRKCSKLHSFLRNCFADFSHFED